MKHRTSRIIALAIVSMTLFFPTSGAQASTDRTDRPDIVFEAFPHQGQGVSFWDSWGARRSGGRRHQGIDIMSPRGTKIVAVADGVVTAMGWHRMSGYFVRVLHAHGWTSVYMHLNNDTLGTDDGNGGTWTAYAPLLMEGDTVRAGDVIGYVGDSGNAEGARPHTHFELRDGDDKVNPHAYLRDAWDRQQWSAMTAGVPV